VTKYSVPDDHWEPDTDESPPAWTEDTSADVEIDVTLHDEGYQTDRKWTVHVAHRVGDSAPDGEDDEVVAAWAMEHRNKGNYWREGSHWKDAVDFVDLPLRVRKRVAAVLGRPLAAITPDERVIRRADDTGIADREGDR
jgi:hypothetical protein